MWRAHRSISAILLILLGSALLLSCGGSKSKSTSKEIPLEILFGVGSKISPLLSPDGEKIAFLSPINGAMNIVMQTIGTESEIVLTDDTLYGIKRFVWGGDGVHILYLRDKQGNGNLRLYDINIDSREVRDLTPFDNIRAQIISVNNAYPDEVLFAMNKDNPGAFSVYRLKLSSGNFQLVAENPGNVIGWIADGNMDIMGCLQALSDGSFAFLYGDKKTGGWHEAILWNSADILDSSPIGFSKDDKYAYVLDSRNANTGRLIRLNLETKDVEVIAEDSIYNVNGAIINPKTEVIEAVTFAREREETIVLDESVRADIQAIQKVHHGDFFISSRSRNDDIWLVGFKTDDGPVPFYRYDRNTKQATLLFYHFPEMEQYSFSKMEAISFTARDGLLIHGYITFPPENSRKKLPMVVYVHDGPWARDSWGYNAEAQWLANRGYICLQVNYRGSIGYGKRFRQAGIRQWGSEMQNDLVDAVKWAIDKGYADSGKVAIAGMGYGGYAALMAAARNDDVFTCAIDISGYTDLVSLMKAIPHQNLRLKQLYYNRVGNPELEADYLKSISPLTLADSIQIPMLIVHGKYDRQVPEAEVKKIVESLNRRDIENQFLLFDNEAHGLTRSENRVVFYQTAEAFLAKHIGK